MSKAGDVVVLQCADCLETFEYVVRPHGRRPACCAACRPQRASSMERSKSTGNRSPGDRSAACLDCGQSFSYAARSGPPPKRCYDCQRRYNAERQKAWREANPERAQEHWAKNNAKRKLDPGYRQYHRDNNIRYKYGITRAELDAMIEAQDNKCAICGNGHVGVGTRLHIDHCHDSKKVRGLLCSNCNTAIGLLGDSPERAEALAAYLRR